MSMCPSSGRACSILSQTARTSVILEGIPYECSPGARATGEFPHLALSEPVLVRSPTWVRVAIGPSRPRPFRSVSQDMLGQAQPAPETAAIRRCPALPHRLSKHEPRYWCWCRGTALQVANLLNMPPIKFHVLPIYAPKLPAPAHACAAARRGRGDPGPRDRIT